jgi:hypothetical protein
MGNNRKSTMSFNDMRYLPFESAKILAMHIAGEVDRGREECREELEQLMTVIQYFARDRREPQDHGWLHERIKDVGTVNLETLLRDLRAIERRDITDLDHAFPVVSNEQGHNFSCGDDLEICCRCGCRLFSILRERTEASLRSCPGRVSKPDKHDLDCCKIVATKEIPRVAEKTHDSRLLLPDLNR